MTYYQTVCCQVCGAHYPSRFVACPNCQKGGTMIQVCNRCGGRGYEEVDGCGQPMRGGLG